jgi:hypothetical protein
MKLFVGTDGIVGAKFFWRQHGSDEGFWDEGKIQMYSHKVVCFL